MRSPTGVIVTSLLPRSNSAAPSSSSSFWIATDNAGWLTKHFAAARPKLRFLRHRDDVRSSFRVTRGFSRESAQNPAPTSGLLEREIDGGLEVAELRAAT